MLIQRKSSSIIVTYIHRERERERERAGIVRLRVKGSVAHVVWCAVEGMTNRQQPWAHRQGQRETARTSKSKQKEVHLKPGQCQYKENQTKNAYFCFLVSLLAP